MRILVIGSGGVGSAVAPIAARRGFFERMTIADVDRGRAQAVVDRVGDRRLTAAEVDASSEEQIVALARSERADAILNAVDPRFNPPIFAAAHRAGCVYLEAFATAQTWLSRATTSHRRSRSGRRSRSASTRR